MIVGIVLAAGRSSRMGTSKALLTLGGRTFLGCCVHSLREGGCDSVLVVVGAGAGGSAAAHEARRWGARVVRNPDPTSEPIDSLRLALARAPDAAAIVVAPVDVAGPEPAAVRALLASFEARGAPVVLPVHRGRRGHPVLFARAVFPELRTGDLPEGARSVVRAHEAELEEVEVETPGVLRDVDTPEEYERLAGGEG